MSLSLLCVTVIGDAMGVASPHERIIPAIIVKATIPFVVSVLVSADTLSPRKCKCSLMVHRSSIGDCFSAERIDDVGAVMLSSQRDHCAVSRISRVAVPLVARVEQPLYELYTGVGLDG